MIKRGVYTLLASAILLSLLLGAKAQAPKAKHTAQLKNQIRLLQAQLQQKSAIIKKLQKENKTYQKQIAEFPREIEKTKLVMEIEKARLMDELSNLKSTPPLFDAMQAPQQHLFIDGEVFVPDVEWNKFVRVNRYNGKELMSNNLYLPMEVVGQVLNKAVEWDSKSNNLYFGKKSPESSPGN